MDLASSDLAIGQLAAPDLSSLDRDLQAVSTLEQAWSLPALPDDVKLDLISTPDLQGGVRDFLTGLDADLQASIAPTPRVQAQVSQFTQATQQQVQAAVAPERQVEGGPPTAMFLPQDDLANQFRRIFASVSGGDRPETLDLNAVSDMKAQAIAKGLLPAGTKVDNFWTPEMNGVRYDLMREDFRSRVAGNRPGAVSSASVLDMIDRWTSPSGLLSAAVALDYLPDVEQIGKEFSGWGDKFRKWWKNKTSPRDFIDAMTGPIDDIAFPLINTALLLSGFSSTLHFAQAARLIAAGDAVGDLARATSLVSAAGLGSKGVQFAGRTFGAVSAADLASDVYRTAHQGLISTRLAKSTHTAAQATGGAMAAWRRATGVMMTKKAIQSGMRVGFMGQVESLLLPNRDPGYGLGGNIDGPLSVRLDDFLSYRTYNPAAYPFIMVAETALSPTSIFKPGTFVDPVTTAAQKIREGFVGVSRDQRTAIELLDSARRYYARTDPEKLKQLEAAAKAADGRRIPGMPKHQTKEQRLLVALLGGDEERAGEIASWLAFQTAVEKRAHLEAVTVLGGAAEGSKYRSLKWRFGNHYKNRIRTHVDIDENDMDTVLDFIRIRSGVESVDTPSMRRLVAADEFGEEWADADTYAAKVRASRRKTYQALLDEFTSPDETVRAAAFDRARAEIAQHNALRQATFNEVLDALEDGDIAGYMIDHDVWATVDNWDNFLHSIDDLEMNLGLSPASVDLTPTRDLWRSWVGADGLQGLAMEADLDGYQLPSQRVPSKWTNGLQKDLVEGPQRITVARLDSPTLQQAELLDAQIRYLLELQDGISAVDTPVLTERFVPMIDEFAASKGKNVADLTNVEVDQFIASTRVSAAGRQPDVIPAQVQAVSSARLRSFARSYRAASKAGTTGGDWAGDLRGRLAALNSDEALWARFRVGTDGDLTDKLKRLRAERAFLAQDVHVADEGLRSRLAAAGYKAVRGTDFSAPSEMLDLGGPLGVIRASHMRRASLGTFLDRHSMETVTQLKERRFRDQAVALLNREVQMGRGLGRDFQLDPNSPDMDDVLRVLTGARDDLLQRAADVEERIQEQGALSRTFMRASNSGLPQSRWMIRKGTLERVFAEMGFSPSATKALIAATRKANELPFRYTGLQGLESAAIANSWTRQAFKVLGFVQPTQGMTPLQRIGSMVGMGQPSPDDVWRVWKRAAGAGLAGAFTYAQTEDPKLALAGAGIGAAVPGAIVNPRNVARFAGGYLGMQAAEAAGVPREQAALLGVFAGVGGVRMLRKHNPAQVGGLFDRQGWFQYSRVGTQVALTRDRVRFALSPIFDIQRYTEGITLSATADLPDGVTLPVTTRPMNRVLKDMGVEPTPHARRAIIEEYNAVSGGMYDLMESTQSRFREIGIMGFSPLEWEAAAWKQMTLQGMDPTEAYEKARNLMTYGIKGRSAAELSVNFVFFPFSFQKKWLGQMAKFMSKDLGRTMAIHSALKTWEILYEEFDLGERWRDHLPLADQLRKINPLAYGINPGQLGGINRPLIDLVLDTPGVGDAARSTMNFFLPQAVRIETEADRDQWDRIARQMLPIWRDAEDLLQDLASQGHVAFSPTHRTAAAEVEAAYAEWGAVKQQAQAAARAQGYQLADVMNASPTSPFYQAKLLLDVQKEELLKKYPGWRESLDRSVENNIERRREIQTMLMDQSTPEYQALAQFEAAVTALESNMQSRGLSLSADPDLVEPEVQDEYRKIAILLAQQNPKFAGLYRTYYQRMFGPIHREIR